ncbi:ABC transporter substrate-binding protein [Amycolatopsis nigrescens]|uniref:ABC transporter substrate-binding protein n=1 Tax=Amycolatopsis nigrescens TaxID=381445 RepID=UPI0003763F9F|nr:extracellular solute-binding protein [Amycolatopsis nigrescens]
MRLTRIGVAAVTAVTAAGLLTGCGSDSGEGGGKVNLKFQSLAFQPASVAAVQKIVQDWNTAHPDIQVEYSQGTWSSVHDQLVTQFAGGTAPDIIHDEAADISGFIPQGYLADISGDLAPEVKNSVPKELWDVVSAEGKTYAAPTLLQSYVVMANTDLLSKNGIEVPSGPSMSWDELQAMAKKATANGSFGVGWGLKSPTAPMMNLGLNFGGTYFTGTDRDAQVRVGDNENQVPRRIHDMAYVDKSLAPTTLTQSGTDVLPGFYAGEFAMVVQGNYVAQQIAEQAPDSFKWTVLPPLSGSSANQAANPQTLSVSQGSEHVKEATAFINYFMQADRLAAVGEGDWLIPATQEARDVIMKATGGENGWKQTLDGARNLVAAPFQAVTNYPRWKDQIATPAFQQYLADKISLPDLGKRLTEGWSQVNQ